uniref:Endosome-associated-trafficking regulator 1 n=1 Tax=Sexangularia sp. CB-2014 TaxID=1486929 RepID=A0A7S1VBZ7_9EUKA
MSDDNPFSFNSFLSGNPPKTAEQSTKKQPVEKVGSIARRAELDSIFDDDSATEESFAEAHIDVRTRSTSTQPTTLPTHSTIPDAFTWSSSEDGEEAHNAGRRANRAAKDASAPASSHPPPPPTTGSKATQPLLDSDDESDLDSDGFGPAADARSSSVPGSGGCSSCAELRDRVRRAEARSLAAETEAAALASGAAAARQDAKVAKERVAALEAREAADTQALVAMLEKIERNLVTMTSRAEAAEARADELARQLLARQEEGSARAAQVFIDAADPGERLQAAQDAGSLAAARLAGALRASEKAMSILMEQAANVRGVAKTLDSLGAVSVDDR